MAQQVGSGAAPAASETEATPGGASGMTETEADPGQNGTKPGPGDKASRGVPAGDEAGGRPGDGKASRPCCQFNAASW